MKNDIINKTYYAYVDTSTIIGKIEQKVLEMFNLTIYKHGKNGTFSISNNDDVFNRSIIKIKWRCDNRDKNILYYDFFFKFFNKYIPLGKLRYDKLYIDKDFNFRGKGFIFNKDMFVFDLLTKPKL
jgi:hypothetical protein